MTFSFRLNVFERNLSYALLKKVNKKVPYLFSKEVSKGIPPRVTPRYPGDSPFKPDRSGYDHNGSDFNPGNGPKLLRKRLWYAVGGVSTFLICAIILPNLEKTPITDRWRLMLVSQQQEAMLGTLATNSLIRQNASLFLPPNDPNVILVHKVIRRVLSAALLIFPELFPPNIALGDLLKSFPINVIKSPIVNASVLPDGNIFVFSGILPIAQEEAGLATVLSHEIAHKLLRHHGERMSLYAILLYLGILGQIAVGGDSFIRSVNELLMKIGILLPNSRRTEIEADHIGLLLMAAACYHPQQAISFWQRMDQAASRRNGELEKQREGTIGQFLSTHPSHGKRSENIEQKINDAMKIWERSNCEERMSPFWDRFKQGNGWGQW